MVPCITRAAISKFSLAGRVKPLKLLLGHWRRLAAASEGEGQGEGRALARPNGGLRLHGCLRSRAGRVMQRCRARCRLVEGGEVVQVVQVVEVVAPGQACPTSPPAYRGLASSAPVA